MGYTGPRQAGPAQSAGRCPRQICEGEGEGSSGEAVTSGNMLVELFMSEKQNLVSPKDTFASINFT